MRGGSRTSPERYRTLELHAHALLRDVPLHDVWEVWLPGGPLGLGISALRPLLSLEDVARSRPVVRWLFGLRRLLGRILRLDPPPATPPEATPFRSATLSRVPAEVLARSRVRPGTPDGPFVVLYELENESLAEVRNRTVHAFSVLALSPGPGGYRGTWAIHVAPVGAITRPYMALIDPFRRHVVYPAILGHLQRRWAERYGAADEGAAPA